MTSSSSRSAATPSSSPLTCPPRCPARRWGRRGKRRKPQGPETRDENVVGEKAKSCARLGGKKFFGGGVLLCRARRRLAARASFPFPWSGPRAGDAGGRRTALPPPRVPAGEDRSHLWVTLSRPESPCPGDAKTLAAGSARTRLPLKDIS